MQVLYRFIQALPNAISPVYNQLIALGDKPFDIFAKLQGLLSVRQLRQVNINAVSGGGSTTADIGIVTLTVPGNRFNIGDVLDLTASGVYTKPISGGTTINFWVKINGVKRLTLPHTPNNTRTNLPWFFKGDLVVRDTGSNGVIVIEGFKLINTATATTTVVNNNGSVVTLDTTANVTIQIGFNFSNSNASNNVTASMGQILQR
jgi:hypothetical protein